jgi:ribonucleoside-diphosphate reductase alpha chain
MVIGAEWHVRMQAAWQDNVTNSVSKTINLPNNASVADIKKSFLLAWETECKAITVYRDGSKNMQVLETGASSNKDDSAQVDPVSPIPRERPSVINGVTEKIRTGHGSMYITINFDEAGSPFEIFSALGKAGGCDSAYLEAISRLASLSLRSGVNESEVIDQLRGITCCPTWDQGVMVSSSPDAVALALMRHQLEHANERDNALEPEAQQSSLFASPAINVMPLAPVPVKSEPASGRMGGLRANQCPECYGTVTFEEGCLKCYSCGYSKC